MKQKQFAPMSVAEMGTVLFAANEGYLEDVPVDKVLDFEEGLLSFMNADYASFVQSTNETGAYNDDVVATLKEIIEKFKATQARTKRDELRSQQLERIKYGRRQRD